jgi:hypothetical protein
LRIEERGMRDEVGISSILHLPSCLLSLLSSFLHLHSSIFTPPSVVLVQAPLSGLILSGRLREHDAWQVARGEQGLVVVPLIGETG